MVLGGVGPLGPLDSDESNKGASKQEDFLHSKRMAGSWNPFQAQLVFQPPPQKLWEGFG